MVAKVFYQPPSDPELKRWRVIYSSLTRNYVVTEDMSRFTFRKLKDEQTVRVMPNGLFIISRLERTHTWQEALEKTKLFVKAYLYQLDYNEEVKDDKKRDT